MHIITKEHFLFADALTQKTLMFKQTLVIHCCWHIRAVVVNHPIAAHDLWTRYLVVEKRKEWFFSLLEEMVIHALSLPAHDHHNPAVGTWRGIQATLNAVDTYHQLRHDNQLTITKETLPVWQELLVREGLPAEYAEQFILAWVEAHASWE